MATPLVYAAGRRVGTLKRNHVKVRAVAWEAQVPPASGLDSNSEASAMKSHTEREDGLSRAPRRREPEETAAERDDRIERDAANYDGERSSERGQALQTSPEEVIEGSNRAVDSDDPAGVDR